MQKIKVAFIYKKGYQFLTGQHFDNTTYFFFMHALKRNSRIDVHYYPADDYFDVSELKGKCDIILLPDNHRRGTPETLANIEGCGIPVVCRVGDPHDAKREKKIPNHEKYKIDYYFNFMPSSYFYQFYPQEFRYREILFGVEPSQFSDLPPYKERINNRILNSGVVGRKSVLGRLAGKIVYPGHSRWYHYRLRTRCNDLPYVDYVKIQDGRYPHERYADLLSQYCAAIAATTYYPTIKYFEIPAAGCLTFMEITPFNNAYYLGFENEETAVFINEKNYKEKFAGYLSDPNNPKWEKIARQGKEFIDNHLNNDVAVDNLVNLFEELV